MSLLATININLVSQTHVQWGVFGSLVDMDIFLQLRDALPCNNKSHVNKPKKKGERDDRRESIKFKNWIEPRYFRTKFDFVHH